MRIKGDLVVFGKPMAKADLGLDTTNGLKAAASITTYKVGPLALEKASVDLQANLKRTPSFKIEGNAAIKGIDFYDSKLFLSNKGIEWVQDQNCTPPMMKITFRTKGLKPVKLSLKPSGCAAKIAKAIAEAGKIAAVQVAKTTKKAAKSAIAAGEKAGKWVGGAAHEAKKFAKNTGCKVKKFFGGSCKKKKSGSRA